MNPAAIGFDWNQVRAFLATMETGTLSAAARALGVAQPTVGRQIAALEESLGLALFERAGRDLVLTPAGRAVEDHVRAMGTAAAQLALVAAGQTKGPGGRVTISASDTVATYLLPDVLASLAETTPDLQIGIVVTNLLSDLMRREADIAIRHVRPEEPGLIARRIRSGQASLYASGDFLRRHGRPSRIEDLRNLPLIGLTAPEAMARMLRARGLPVSEAGLPFFSENTVAGWELVRRGLGIGLMADDIAAKTPGVERILPDFWVSEVDLWLVSHRELHRSARIRRVWDHLAGALRNAPERG
ncbi:LysR family transcriptional regulator [Pararhodobacter marinus]|uniref:LysR family transcriptional regulator n=1 Tax=Pararhodobacter marinus TaxID=2184063 RepID=A0A2U2CEB3_9RHOB|nr:LysR family transcriptional regulator [Pararhodobacter marinus]PWE30235.1 LysR family transcriptional regulator [Pararhodobacter marinus]